MLQLSSSIMSTLKPLRTLPSALPPSVVPPPFLPEVSCAQETDLVLPAAEDRRKGHPGYT